MPPFLLGALKAKPMGKWDPGRLILVCPLAPLRHIRGHARHERARISHPPTCYLQHWPWPRDNQVEILRLQQQLELQPPMQWETAPAVTGGGVQRVAPPQPLPTALLHWQK